MSPHETLTDLTERSAELAEAGDIEAALAVAQERLALAAALPPQPPAAAAAALSRALAAESRLSAALEVAAADVVRRMAALNTSRGYAPAPGVPRAAFERSA